MGNAGSMSAYGMRDGALLTALEMCEADWDLARIILNYLGCFAHWMPFCRLGRSPKEYEAPHPSMVSAPITGVLFMRVRGDTAYPYPDMSAWLHLSVSVQLGRAIPNDKEFIELVTRKASPDPRSRPSLASIMCSVNNDDTKKFVFQPGPQVIFQSGLRGNWYQEYVKYRLPSNNPIVVNEVMTQRAFVPTWFPLYMYYTFSSRLTTSISESKSNTKPGIKLNFRLHPSEVQRALQLVSLPVPDSKRLTIDIVLNGKLTLMKIADHTTGTQQLRQAAVWHSLLPIPAPSEPDGTYRMSLRGVVEQVFLLNSSEQYLSFLCEAPELKIDPLTNKFAEDSDRVIDEITTASIMDGGRAAPIPKRIDGVDTAIARTMCFVRDRSMIQSLSISV